MYTLAAVLITAFLSNGTTCSGKNYATSIAVTPRFNATLCIKTDTPLCGVTYRFERVTTTGTIRVNKSTPALGFEDAVQVITFPQTITKAEAGDWGVMFPSSSLGTLKIATLNITIIGSKPLTNYTFKLDAVSHALIDPGRDCGLGFVDRTQTMWEALSWPMPEFVSKPITATFTLKKS